MHSSLQATQNGGHIAVAMPGPFDYNLGVSWMKGMGKFDSLYGLNVRELMLSKFSKKIKTVTFVNDASCFLQGELSYGPASKYSRVMGITLGTGFGSAIGLNGIAKDANYWQYSFMGATCEDFFSSKWLVSRYNKIAYQHVENVRELIDTATHSGPLLQVFDEFAYNLGVLLVKIANELKLDCIVIGGNIAKAWPQFLPQLQDYLKLRSVALAVYISTKGEHAALIGAASTVNFNLKSNS